MKRKHLKAGQLLEILWRDHKPTIALLLEKPEKCKGDISLHLYHFKTKSYDNHATLSQVRAIRGKVKLPKIHSDLRYPPA